MKIFGKEIAAKEHPVVVLGAGESGVGAALLAQQQGYDVFVSDYGNPKSGFVGELDQAGIAWEQGGHDMDRILAAGLVIKSPGIAEKTPVMRSVREASIPVISEIEWAYRFIDGQVIAITGSNGKTTTTSWIYDMLHRADLDVALTGNIGKSLARAVVEKQSDYYVVEVSSFQLDDIDQFHPYISVITNITEDHLDRYDYKIENYIASKLSIAKNQTGADHCIYCADDEVTLAHLSNLQHTQLLPFSWESLASDDVNGAWRDDDQIIYQLKKNDSLCQ